MPSAILPAAVARIAKKAGFALLAACLPVVVHGQLSTDATHPHALSSYSDPAGRLQLKAEYDSAGRLIKQTDAAGHSVQIAHREGAAGEGEQTVKGRNGGATTYRYDARGNVTQITDAAGGITRYQYDANDNETSVTEINLAKKYNFCF